MKNQKNQIKLKAKVSEKWTHALLLFNLLFCALHSCVVVLLIWFISCFPHFVQSIINEPNKRTKNTHNKSSIWRTGCVIVLLSFLHSFHASVPFASLTTLHYKWMKKKNRKKHTTNSQLEQVSGFPWLFLLPLHYN